MPPIDITRRATVSISFTTGRVLRRRVLRLVEGKGGAVMVGLWKNALRRASNSHAPARRNLLQIN
jgi:hypothetical protein